MCVRGSTAVMQDLFHPNPGGFDGLHVKIDENPSRPIMGAYPADRRWRERLHDILPLRNPIVIFQPDLGHGGHNY